MSRTPRLAAKPTHQNTFHPACVSHPYRPRVDATARPEKPRPEGTLIVGRLTPGATFEGPGAARMPGDTVYLKESAYEVIEVVNGVQYEIIPWDEYPPIPEPPLTAENAHERADAMHGTGSYPVLIRDKAWSVAYEEHHAYGLSAVVNEYGEIADLLHWAFKRGMAAAQ